MPIRARPHRRLAREHLHQVVVERDVEAARPLVALAARPPAQLVVDATRLVPLRADHVQPAQVLDTREPADPVQQEPAQPSSASRNSHPHSSPERACHRSRVPRAPSAQQRKLQLRKRHLLASCFRISSSVCATLR
jgi:hypothetical protein